MRVKRTREQWRPAPGWEHVYEVSDAGRLRRIGSGRLLTGYVNTSGYRQMNLRHQGVRTQHLLHRLVAEAFLGPAPSETHQVNHIDGDKLNNAVANLEWVTPSRNHEHAYALDLRSAAGERNPRAKLTRQQVQAIRDSADVGVALARRYGVTPTLISMIRRHKIWR